MKNNALLVILIAIFAPQACASDESIGYFDEPGPAPEETIEEEADPVDDPVDDPTDDPGTEEEEPAEGEECRKVDILFVIDNSASMSDNQMSLIASFPGFVAGIRERLVYSESYHIGIVTSDDYWHNKPGCRRIGNLVTQTGGLKSSDSGCAPFSSGARFMDETEPDLAGKFACAAQVGTGGNDDERPMAALLGALSPEQNAPGDCNAGFLRDDALLVVVIISDEDDVPDVCDGLGNCDTYGSGGTPDEWFEAVVMAKGGFPQNAVVLSLVGLRLDNACGAVPAAKLIGFANRFGGNGYTDDVCAESYDDFFTAVLPIIDQACEDFVLI